MKSATQGTIIRVTVAGNKKNICYMPIGIVIKSTGIIKN
jgi:hypothetical protein